MQHGRLKVKSTAEQQEAKRKEREKKLKIYNAATARVFEKVCTVCIIFRTLNNEKKICLKY